VHHREGAVEFLLSLTCRVAHHRLRHKCDVMPLIRVEARNDLSTAGAAFDPAVREKRMSPDVLTRREL
jgi:hypothetical protein